MKDPLQVSFKIYIYKLLTLRDLFYSGRLTGEAKSDTYSVRSLGVGNNNISVCVCLFRFIKIYTVLLLCQVKTFVFIPFCLYTISFLYMQLVSFSLSFNHLNFSYLNDRITA